MQPEHLPRLQARLFTWEQASERIPTEHTRAAVALCLAPGEHGLDLLLMRRVEHPCDPWSGQISLPGGREEPGDLSLSHTARRETQEEVGLDLSPHAPCAPQELGLLAPIQARSRGGLMSTTVVPFVHLLAARPPTTPGPEASSTFWLPLHDVQSGTLSAKFPYTHADGKVHTLPCWNYADHRIWGLTWRIVSGMLERC